ncbi:MAG: hypothetical protein QG577_1232 [Thermodesulfobacteriota bacterium]|nr:hypothetical protein [Thermodesulfobacteriota bacterium]
MKTVQEISVKLENRPGTLSEVSELLGANTISILALTVRTDGKIGLMNFIASDPIRAQNIMQSAGYETATHEIIAAEMPHHPGGLNAILKPLKLAGVNIEYVYSCIGSYGSVDRTILLLGVSDTVAAHNALSAQWIKLFGEELYNL